MTRELAGRVALVTGAGRNIGRAIARELAAGGAAVVVNARANRAEADGVAAEIASAGGRATVALGDVTDAEAVAGMVRAALETFGRLDILVNNAIGGARGGRLTETTLAQWNATLAVGITGVFLMSRVAVRQMLTQPANAEGVRGRIVNIGSQHGMVAAPEDVAYGVAKAGTNYITRQIAVDYAKEGIVCNAVAPGKILTGKTGRAVEPRWLEYSRARTPWPRLGRSEDVANAALFLASDEATYITGEVLMVDGGWMAY